MEPTALQQHYRPRELAKLWSVSAKTIIRRFRNEPGVVRLGAAIMIPASVACRVYETLDQQRRVDEHVLRRKRLPLAPLHLGYKFREEKPLARIPKEQFKKTLVKRKPRAEQPDPESEPGDFIFLR